MNLSEQREELLNAGFSDSEIQEWQTQKMGELLNAGFSEEEIKSSLGFKTPDMAPFKNQVRENIQTKAQGGKPLSFLEALDAGAQASVSGLLLRQKLPDTELTGQESRTSRLAYMGAQMAGDVPAMAAGFAIGGGMGAATGPGAAITGTAGAFALPAGMRATLIDGYSKGSFKSFGDFWDRAKDILVDEAKGWVTGAATGAAGVGAAVATKAAPAIVQATAPTASELAAMTAVGPALDGQVPSARDFEDSAIFLFGLKGARAGTSKLMSLYKNAGIKPDEAVVDTRVQPSVLQDLASSNIETPKAYEPFAERPQTKDEIQTEAPAAPPAPDTPQQRVLAKVDTSGSAKKQDLSFSKFYTAFVDDLNPINKITADIKDGEKVEAAEDPYTLARLVRGSSGRAQAFLEHGAFDFNTYETTGPSLKSVLGPIKDDLDGFRSYIVSKRAIDLEGRGITSGVDANDAASVVKEGSAKYQETLNKLNDYQTSVLRYLRDSGVVGDDAYKAMKTANKDYVPFYRFFEDQDSGGYAFGKSIGARNPIKSIKGSERNIIDPLESIVKNTFSYIDIANKNEVIKSFHDLAAKTENPGLFFEEVKGPKKPVNVSDSEIKSFFEKHGIDYSGDEALTVFREMKKPLAKDELAFYENGKRKVIRVDPDVATAFKTAGNKQTANFMLRLLSLPASLLRAGATLSPEFMVRNIMRDQLTATVNSKKNFIPFFSFAKGLASVLKKDEAYQDWLKGGGAHGTLVSLDRDYIRSEIYNLIDKKPETNFLDKAWNVLKSPLDILRVMSEISENATRVGEFKKYNAQTKPEKIKAAFASREVTLDFSRKGSQIQALNMITAFLNVGIQGPDKLLRTIKENPMGSLATIAASTTIPSVLLWYANHDDPRWKDLPAWQRDLFWIVMTKEHIYRVPKPFETGIIFGSGIERMLDAVAGDMDAKDLQEYLGSVSGGFLPNFVPTATQPVLEQITNYSFFRGRPLIPSSLEKILPEYQYTDYTTETSKALASVVSRLTGGGSFSPIVADNYVRQWTGGLGSYALRIADEALEKTGVVSSPQSAISTLEDIPIIKAFMVRYPSASSESIQRFREEYAESEKYVNTLKMQAKEGNTEAVQRLIETNPSAFVRLDGINRALNEQSQLIHMITQNKDIPSDERRQLVDQTYYGMIEIARSGLEIMKSVKSNK